MTDVRRPEFRELEIERGGDWLPDGVVEVRCKQEGNPVSGKLGKEYEDPLPNRYKFYTPLGTCNPRVVDDLSAEKFWVKMRERSMPSHGSDCGMGKTTLIRSICRISRIA